MSNLAVYLMGVVLVVGALAYGAHLLGLSNTWIAVGAVVILGFGIIGAVSSTRRKEPSPEEEA